MSRYVVDIEADGLYYDATKLHSIVLKDATTGELVISASSHAGNLEQAATTLGNSEILIGHNIIKYDIPLLSKIYPRLSFNAKLLDTLILGRLLHPTNRLRISDRDIGLSGKAAGSHSLENWGYRIGAPKLPYSGGWETWSPEMQRYCEADVGASWELWRYFWRQANEIDPSDGLPVVPIEVFETECKVAAIISRQERYGVAFNKEKAQALLHTLMAEHARITDELSKHFYPRYLPKDCGRTFIPKKDNVRLGYTAGAGFCKVELTPFNPGSRQHISKWLKVLNGWEPTEFTPTGEPKVDEEILDKLPWPEAKVLSTYLMITKRISQLATGNQAWLLNVHKDGRIHGEVNTLGTITYRMSHSNPNCAQVPSVSAPYGVECRELFEASEGKVLVGIDADALELVCFAHYMSYYDGGVYAEAVTKGDKKEGTDAHSMNASALGLNPKRMYQWFGKEVTGRDIAKVWFFAMIYGAGLFLLGQYINDKGTESQIYARGSNVKRKFIKRITGFSQLLNQLKWKVERKQTLRCVDGRTLNYAADHAAFNALLQACGAIVMKSALVIFDNDLKARGFEPGADYEFVLNIHDEWQIETLPEHAETIGKLGVWAITTAAERLGLRCKLSGTYKIGSNWRETH